MGRLLPVGSELAGVGLPLHCSHTKRDDRNLPDSGRSIGGALDGSTSQIGHELTSTSLCGVTLAVAIDAIDACESSHAHTIRTIDCSNKRVREHGILFLQFPDFGEDWDFQ